MNYWNDKKADLQAIWRTSVSTISASSLACSNPGATAGLGTGGTRVCLVKFVFVFFVCLVFFALFFFASKTYCGLLLVMCHFSHVYLFFGISIALHSFLPEYVALIRSAHTTGGVTTTQQQFKARKNKKASSTAPSIKWH